MILGLRGRPLPAFALGWGWVLRLHERNAGVPYGIALAGAALALYPQSELDGGPRALKRANVNFFYALDSRSVRLTIT